MAEAALRLGTGSLLAKIDIKSAYRLIPVHPADRYIMGTTMCMWMVCSRLGYARPVRSSLKSVTHMFHYLDDFHIMRLSNSATCAAYLHILEAVCHRLGVPLAPNKREGPSCILVFIIDTIRGELRLQIDKLQRLLSMVDTWLSKRSCTRRELESLIGSLQHACKAASSCVRQLHFIASPNASTITSG